MKKRILAIFLCLILTVSLATAGAAENDVITPGGTYTVTLWCSLPAWKAAPCTYSTKN